jgi:hypothetical protein
VTWLNTSVQYGFARSASEAMFPRLFPDAGWWCPSLNPAMGGTRLWDLSGRQNWGTLTNMANNDWVMNDRKGALDFDGSDDHVLLTNPPEFLYTMPFSVSLWATCRTTTAVSQPFGFGNSTDADQLFAIQFRGDVAGDPIQVQMRGNSNLVNTAAVFSGPYVANQLYHIVAVFSSASSRTIYVDGVQGTTDTTTYTVEPINRMAIGALVRTTVSSHNGIVDDVRIYNRALTASDARQLTQIGRGNMPLRRRRRYTEQAAGFKAYWARNRSSIIGAGNVSS